MQKLEEKNFNGIDVYWFLQIFNIGIWIVEPYFPPMMFVRSDEDLVKQRKQIELDSKVHYQKQLDRENAKWEEANIAANYEKHK